MSVGILLVTHNDIGASLLESLQKMLGTLPLPVKVLSVPYGNDSSIFHQHVNRLCQSLNQGDGVLVLTDLHETESSQIACSLLPQTHRIRIVSGVNLPMLVKLMNYPKKDLDTLANSAISGGCQGILDVNSILNPS